MRYPCIFHELIVRETINPLIDERYKEKYGAPPKKFYAALTKFWREKHCAELNPYSSDDCPYDKEDCAVAYYRDVQAAVSQAKTQRGVLGLFGVLASKSGIRRADNKPLARTLYTRTDVQQPEDDRHLSISAPEGPLDDMGRRREGGNLRGMEEHPGSGDGGDGLRRPSRRPVRIGDMFRKNDVRSHPPASGGNEGQAGLDEHGDPLKHL